MDKDKNKREEKPKAPNHGKSLKSHHKVGKHTGRNKHVVRTRDQWATPASQLPTTTEYLASVRKPLPATVAAREKLAQAGILATDLGIPEDIAPVSDEALERWGEMRPGARSSEELLNEDRGTY